MGCKKPSCFFLCDRVGCLPESTRTCILIFDMLVMAVALGVRIVAVTGISSSEDVLEAVPWSTLSPGDPFKTAFPDAGDTGTIYFNLWGAVIKLPSNQDYCETTYYVGSTEFTVDACKGASWDDLADSRPPLLMAANTSYFDDCKDAAIGSRNVVIIGLIATIFAIISRACCNSRFSRATDAGKKCIILITTVLPCITAIGAIANYNVNCIENINDAIDDVPAGSTITVLGNLQVPRPLDGAEAQLGPGLQALIVGLVMNATSFVLQLLLPGNKDGVKEKEKDVQFTNTAQQPQAQP